MNTTQTQLNTDTWVTATWQEYIQTIQDPTYEKAKVYLESPEGQRYNFNLAPG